MIGNNYILDTNIVSAWLKKENAVIDKINSSGLVFIPIIVIGEMYYGAQFSTRVNQNINNIAIITSNYPLLYVTEEVCKVFGMIKASLRRNGTPIPENDIWIAAIAVQNKLPLVTRDKHFNIIDGLKTENW